MALIQSTLTPQERYYCIHCNWIGFTPTRGQHNLCPECEWVCYPESSVAKDYPVHGPYKILFRKFAKVHNRNLEQDVEDYANNSIRREILYPRN